LPWRSKEQEGPAEKRAIVPTESNPSTSRSRKRGPETVLCAKRDMKCLGAYTRTKRKKSQGTESPQVSHWERFPGKGGGSKAESLLSPQTGEGQSGSMPRPGLARDGGPTNKALEERTRGTANSKNLKSCSSDSAGPVRRERAKERKKAPPRQKRQKDSRSEKDTLNVKERIGNKHGAEKLRKGGWLGRESRARKYRKRGGTGISASVKVAGQITERERTKGRGGKKTERR